MNGQPAWVAAFGDEAGPRGEGARDPQVLAVSRLHLWRESGKPPLVAERAGTRVIFDGVLYDRHELALRLHTRPAADASAAELVRDAYDEWGAGVLPRLRGIFAMMIWDSARECLLCARDPAGLHPLFYCDAGRTLLVSPSIEALLEHPCVSRAPNRAGFIDHLERRWLDGSETYFAAIRRVPPCHVMQLDRGGRRHYRYWDPAPPAQAAAWVADAEAEDRFEGAFEKAVERCLSIGRAGVNFSGGLDSSSVAMVATDLCRRGNGAEPWLMSLVFSGPDVDEANVQRGLAAALEVPHCQVSFDEAARPRGALVAALDMSRTLPAPVVTPLRPGLHRLVCEASQRGCEVLLSGDGADEWVAMNQHFAADLVRSFNVVGLYRLWRTLRRSYPAAVETPLHAMFWRWGARLVLADAWYGSPMLAPVRSVVSGRVEETRTRSRSSTRPVWLAPDPALRAEVERRETQAWVQTHAYPKTRGYCLRSSHSTLGLPQKFFFHEENFTLAARAGVRVAPPFWDADLIELLMAIRPHVRMRDGYTKSLMRRALVERFPRLGFESRLKSYTGHVILSALKSGAAEVRRALGPKWTLGELGIVRADRLDAFLGRVLANGADGEWMQVWDLLNLETWARAHMGRP